MRLLKAPNGEIPQDMIVYYPIYRTNDNARFMEYLSVLNYTIRKIDENRNFILLFDKWVSHADNDLYDDRDYIMYLVYVWKTLFPREMKKANTFVRRLYDEENW